MKPSTMSSAPNGNTPSAFRSPSPTLRVGSRLVFLLVLLAGSTLGFGQGFHLGVKGGANLFKVDGKSFSEEFQYGYNAGAFAEINFSKKLGIQPEVLWNQSRTRLTNRFEDMYDGGFGELKNVKLNYLSIPLLLNYSPAKFFTLQVGPQFGIMIDNRETFLVNGRNAFRSGDFSLLGGAQLNIGGVKLGGRYAVGLSNINDIDKQDRWKNQGFQLYLGFRII